jgi:hypothetical protein
MSISAWSKALVAIAAVMLVLPVAAMAAPPAKTGSLTRVGMSRSWTAA